MRGLSWFEEELNVIKASGAGLMLMLLLLGGCAPTPQQLRMERDLEEMKRRLAETERTLASQRETLEGSSRDRFDAMGRRQADLQVGLEGIRVELQTINGRLADSTARSRELRDTVALVQEDLSLKVSALEGRITELEKRPVAPPPPPPPAAEPTLSATAQYDKGVALVQKKGAGEDGRKVLEAFLREHPKHELVPNALYWIGEAYYGEKAYESAILQFQDVIQKHAKHQKVPAAMLKQGMAFNALKDRKSARAILRRLTEEFPKSEEAKKAKELLKSWDK